jgi:hypothetical protein
MPSTAHPAAPGALGLGDNDGAMRRALGREITREVLGRLDFVEVMDDASDDAGLMMFDRAIGMLGHAS